MLGRDLRGDSPVFGAVRWIAECGNYSTKAPVDKELENGLHMPHHRHSPETFDNVFPAYPKTRVF